MLGCQVSVSSLKVKRAIRKVIGLTALLGLLLFATFAGEVLHHHDDASPDTHCQICHLSHQFLERVASDHRAASPELLGSLPAPQDPLFVVSLRTPLLGTRAPPSA
jgi:hypothetical protein